MECRMTSHYATHSECARKQDITPRVIWDLFFNLRLVLYKKNNNKHPRDVVVCTVKQWVSESFKDEYVLLLDYTYLFVQTKNSLIIWNTVYLWACAIETHFFTKTKFTSEDLQLFVYGPLHSLNTITSSL